LQFIEQHQLDTIASEALQSLRASMPQEAVSIADALGEINGKYVRTERDKELELAISKLIVNAAAEFNGTGEKLRILFVIGESGSGKTTAIRKHLFERKELQPRQTEYGEIIHPMVSFDAPKPLTIALLAKKGLEAIGYPLMARQLKENEIWDLFKHQLRERRVLFLHIDEMQHVMRGNGPTAIQHVADTIKSLTQIEGWPLHLILSGVPALGMFLFGEDQMRNRKSILNFREIVYPDNVALMRKIVRHIVEVHASLKADGITTEDAIHRLIHATKGGFGTMIQYTRAAVKQVLFEGKTTVGLDSFAKTYSDLSGCNPSENIFIARDFELIQPGNALLWLNPDVEEREEQSKKRKRKGAHK